MPSETLSHYAQEHGAKIIESYPVEVKETSLNTHVAVVLTKGVGTMWTAYTFVVLAFIGLFAILGLLNPIGPCSLPGLLKHFCNWCSCQSLWSVRMCSVEKRNSRLMSSSARL